MRYKATGIISSYYPYQTKPLIARANTFDQLKEQMAALTHKLAYVAEKSHNSYQAEGGPFYEAWCEKITFPAVTWHVEQIDA